MRVLGLCVCTVIVHCNPTIPSFFVTQKQTVDGVTETFLRAIKWFLIKYIDTATVKTRNMIE